MNTLKLEVHPKNNYESRKNIASPIQKAMGHVVQGINCCFFNTIQNLHMNFMAKFQNVYILNQADAWVPKHKVSRSLIPKCASGLYAFIRVTPLKLN